jgi:hypothetical protein
MGTKKSVFVGVAVVLIGLLSGCSAAVSETSSSVSTAATATASKAATSTKAPTPIKAPVGPPLDGGSYATAVELRTAAEAAGLVCTSWVVQELKYASGGNCGDGKDILAVYSDQSSLDEQLAAWSSFGKMVEMKVLVGKNWSINSASATNLQKKLGGKLFTTPGK